MKLSDKELRVLGVLIEKAITTPDQYPLSLNALTTGCNQKTNREPVVNYSDTDAQDIIDGLMKKSLVREVRFGGRVAKYQHRFCNTEFSEYKFSAQELGVLCVLFLRGPQTAGELRTRTNRLCDFSGVQHVETTLDTLQNHDGGPYVMPLQKEPGRRELRYQHLFLDADVAAHGSVDASEPVSPDVGGEVDKKTYSGNDDLIERVDLLELTVEDLQKQIAELKSLVST